MNNRTGAEIMRRRSGEAISFIRMVRRANPCKTIVCVEGGSDISFYKSLIDDKNVEIEKMEGKLEAIEAVTNSYEKGMKGILAIVDSDFDNLLKIESVENIIKTDTHDIETLMLREEFIFRLIDEYYSDKRKKESLGYKYEDIRNLIIEIGTIIGKFRLLSIERGWNINFRSVETEFMRGDYISVIKNKIHFDENKYVKDCVENSSRCVLGYKEVYKIIKSDNRDFDTWQICRGHDLTTIISVFFSKGIIGIRDVHMKAIETSISFGYIASGEIKNTKMFKELKKWQQKNSEWKMLNNLLV